MTNRAWASVAVAAALAALAAPSGRAATGGGAAEARNLELVAHHDLGGRGDGGEGLAIQARPDGRRLLYLAHEGQKTCLSVLDVTDAAKPVLVAQLPSPAPGVTRCNSLGLAGDVLAVANQTLEAGQKTAGMWLLDVSDPARVARARSLDDLRLGFLDTSGPRSRGVHWLWFTDGEFAHLSTGAADFTPTDPHDDQFYMIVDVRDPRRPREVGRWWLPGTRAGDACLPSCLPKRQPIDDGYRAHDIQLYPQRPDRAYVGYMDAGALILDVSALADVRAGRAARATPRLVSRLDYSPPFPAWTHTLQPLFRRGLATISDEAVQDGCKDAPKLIWLADIRDEANPLIVGTAPLPEDVADLCRRGGRFGAHNLHPNFPAPTSAKLENSFVGTFFNGGVRAYRLVDAPLRGAPPRVEEAAYYVPAAPPGNASGAAQINHVLVDDRGLFYAVDRFTGGLYVLKYTGREPLD
jgi:hypothetical protein